MDTVYYLSTCDTCRKILASLPKNNLALHDIKANPLTEKEVDALAKLAGSYEALFSRRAERYKAYGLKDQKLTEADYKKYLLDHYTFLSRPVFVIGGKIFVGNSKSNVENVIAALS
ncbi:putative arsenate reductase (Glutaredoxin) [Flavobacterium longum]|uniref:arsenate reductase family protein n=1 Tax=Flavobacterium longum TaxID=1299340 RepID=UPI0039E82A0D